MGTSSGRIFIIAFLVIVMGAGLVQARWSVEADSRKGLPGDKATVGQPVQCLVAHQVGQIVLGVTNNGSLGTNNTPAVSDWFTGGRVPDCEFPKNSNMQYLFSGAFWIGAVIGRDTLVSVGADGWQTTQEMYPDEEPFGVIIKRSILNPEVPEFEGAISEEDYVAVYTDTLTEGVDADFFGRPHMPLHIEATQNSYAWSYSYAEDFVLFDYRIKNIGTRTLEDVYMGVYVDADVKWEPASTGFDDDICGFLEVAVDTCVSCEWIDSTVFTAWIADNDGDFDQPYGDGGALHPAPAVTATRVVRTPQDSLDVSFNWWIGNGNPALDFGPREKPFVGRWQEDLRDFRTGGLGTPEGDVNKYYSLRNREFDYDQIYTASIQPNDQTWLYPNQSLAGDFADGFDTRYLLSFGPFDIDPGQTLPVSFAYVAGDSLHQAGSNAIDLLPDDPDGYYAQLDFSDLAKNSRWASWVYDNPGVDTDGDGKFGEFVTCPSDSEVVEVDTLLDTTSLDPLVVDTVITEFWEILAEDTCWITGDNVPDFRGASPPPAPTFWLLPEEGKVKIRFNGLRSETTEDVFSREKDFEGYRIYFSRDERASSYSLLESYDQENYNKWVLVNIDEDRYELRETPFTLQELRCMYGFGEDPCSDTIFHPLTYVRTNPYRHPDHTDSVFYFEPQDYNVSELGEETGIVKIYPDEPYPPTLIADTAAVCCPEVLTEDGYFRYFEYEYEIDNLLPHVAYYVNVTAFDYGSPVSGLASLETPVGNGSQIVYPLDAWEAIESSDKQVYVFPNPYRIDADYRDSGYEGRGEDDRPADRVRGITFANLPPVCTIKIFTLDGDLVRELDHEKPVAEGDATIETWNLITRNTQLVVSGLYYWTVETPNGEMQLGKLAIIM